MKYASVLAVSSSVLGTCAVIVGTFSTGQTAARLTLIIGCLILALLWALSVERRLRASTISPPGAIDESSTKEEVLLYDGSGEALSQDIIPKNGYDVKKLQPEIEETVAEVTTDANGTMQVLRRHSRGRCVLKVTRYKSALTLGGSDCFTIPETERGYRLMGSVEARVTGKQYELTARVKKAANGEWAKVEGKNVEYKFRVGCREFRHFELPLRGVLRTGGEWFFSIDTSPGPKGEANLLLIRRLRLTLVPA